MTDALTKHHADSPNGMDDVSRNPATAPHFADVLNARLSRRNVLKGGFGLAASGFFSTTLLAGCLDSGGSSSSSSSSSGTSDSTPSFSLGFGAVAKSTADVLTVPAGYTVSVLYRLGDPINAATGEYANNGSDTAASFASRAGDHHDGMAYFGLNAAGTAKDLSNASRGLLCMNHENITQIFLHTATEVAAGMPVTGRVVSQIDKEVNAHGVSVIEVSRSGSSFAVNRASSFNRRLTAASDMTLSGPASGHSLLKTKYAVNGDKTRGTLNNCANGVTPWGTYLTCEENWAGYFKRPASSTLPARAKVAQERYIGASVNDGAYGWANPTGGDTSGTDLYNRWDINLTGSSETADFRNAANTFGWVVEVDPFSVASTPRKRTAMGRFGHEGAMPAKVTAGKPIVYYMGDDARNEYIYKYVSTQNWNSADANGGLTAGDKYLNDGKLYVAQFAADGSGTWLELKLASIPASYTAYSFADQGDLLINCRLAADALGATPMDRPEWTGVHPVTGDVYVTLTNNSERGKTGNSTGGKSRGLDAANPRYYADAKGSATQTGNVNGHIIRIQENGSDPAATAFKWDVYLFGAQADADGKTVNLSGLTGDNDFSSPDGLWFSNVTPGLMWLQTDDGAYTDVTNCMMLAALPGSRGDGNAVSVTSTAVPSNGGADQTVKTYAGKAASPATLKRFLVGPKGCEITGITETPDGKTIFVNIQHAGENTAAANIATPASFESHWPDGGTARPRSATIVITKNDGGVVGS